MMYRDNKNTHSKNQFQCSKHIRHLVLASVLLIPAVTMTGCSRLVDSLTGSESVGVLAGDRTFSQRLRDRGIQRDALVNLYKLDKRFESSARISIHAFHDAVLITGQVPDAHLKNLATDNAKAIREVKVVHNDLMVGQQANYSEILEDNLITASINKDLLLTQGVKESRVKVVVEKGVVYLMGILADDETSKVLSIVQNTRGVQRIVSLIDRIEDVEKYYASRRQLESTKNTYIPPSLKDETHKNETHGSQPNYSNTPHQQNSDVTKEKAKTFVLNPANTVKQLPVIDNLNKPKPKPYSNQPSQ